MIFLNEDREKPYCGFLGASVPLLKEDLENTYFGFAKDKKPLAKSSIYKTLDRKFIFPNGRLLSRKEYIYYSMYQYSAFVECIENYSYYKRDGEKTVPKNQYRLNFPYKNSYLIITKTEFEYARYLLEKGFLNSDKAKAFIENEKTEKEKERQEKEDAKRKEEEERERAINERASFSAWWRKEAMEIPDSDHINEINKEYLKNGIDCGVLLTKKMILLLNNLDKRVCQNDLLEWLHNDNPASKKAFTMLTGVELPSTNKDTEKVLREYIKTHSKGE